VTSSVEVLETSALSCWLSFGEEHRLVAGAGDENEAEQVRVEAGIGVDQNARQAEATVQSTKAWLIIIHALVDNADMLRRHLIDRHWMDWQTRRLSW